jgi:maltokinase
VSGLSSTSVADQLLRTLSGARWFAGKGRRAELRSLTPLPWLNADGPDGPRVRIEIAEIGYPDEGSVEYYQLALAYRTAPVEQLASAETFRLDGRVAYDAMQDPDGCRVVLEALVDRREVSGDTGVTRFHLRDGRGLSADLEPRIFRGQQSNTSVMYGEVAMIKLFRRLELGRNLDIQVHAALNDAGVADVARLFGWAEASWSSDGQVLGADLAMCVEKLADAVDGWGLALDALASENDEPAQGASFTEHAEALGTALAETHRALRDAIGTTDAPGAGMAEVMAGRLAAAAAAAPALAPYADGLRRCFADLAASHLDTQRVHGDFHLGQTLHTPSGWKIIDFEGEPAKSLAERVAPDAVWRDVAGMLRSFDYAAASVPGPAGPGWRDACREAFLAGYTGGRPLAEQERVLLRAYEADKAVYEVVYEVRNRPDWVDIPLGAVATLTQTKNNKEQQ